LGGDRRGIARASQGPADARDVPGLHPHPLHALDVGADVFGGDVAAGQTFHEAPEGPEQGLAAVFFGITDDHRFAASQVETRGGALEGHAPGEAQDVLQGVFGALVRPHSGPAQAGSQGRVVKGDDRLQARHFVVAEGDLLVVLGGDLLEDVHGRPAP
jgi:hypothetical protein